MKIIKLATLGILGGVLSLGLFITQTAFSQTSLQFTGVKATPENAIQLFWTSITNEVYRVEYTDSLSTQNWQTLYDDYPSQGTNTFIGDFGNYFLAPPILHPGKMPMRFYRLVDKGANSGASPSVAIASTTNGATLSGQVTVTVVVTSSLPIVTTALYVDGQLMDSSDDGSNYVINTCEWLNGPHVLFATANAQSTLSGPSGAWPVSIGRGASPYVSVNFTNLISEIAFSQPFFEPSLGQTQQVTASFAANVDWTLQIIDESSNTVRTATGSGTSMLFNWDGTGDGGTNIPDGVYYYLISAQTNGQAYQSPSSGGSSGGGSGSPPSPLFASTELLAMPADGSGGAVPLAIYPPGYDTNNLVIFEGSMTAIQPQRLSSFAVMSSDSMDGSSSYSGPSAQSAAPAPGRPPANPVKNAVGKVGVAFYDFVSQKSYPVPDSGLPYPLNKVQIENSTGNVTFTNMSQAPACANNFVARMRKKGWGLGFNLSSGTVRLNDLRSASLGGNEIFGGVNLGLFIDHGSYGTSLDYNSDANQSYETYLPGDNPSDAFAPWLRLSEFGLGGDLRWMAMLACNILCDPNYGSMLNQGALPIGNNLHLLCSASTFAAVGDNIGALWATKMTRSIFAGGPETVRQAWYDAGHDQYKNATGLTGITSIVFRVAGSDNCLEDTLKDYAGSTSGTITYRDQQVYP